jgi:hypothetical protein
VKGFAQTVHGYWTQLIRGTNSSILCPQGLTGCESSLIPLNHTFVVPGETVIYFALSSSQLMHETSRWSVP